MTLIIGIVGVLTKIDGSSTIQLSEPTSITPLVLIIFLSAQFYKSNFTEL